MSTSDPQAIAREAYDRLEHLILLNPAQNPAVQACMMRTLHQLKERIESDPDCLSEITHEIERHVPPKT
jgi:hypothetical protein